MTFNSQEIIQEVRAEFEHLLDFVTGEQARTAKANNIERGLFKMLVIAHFAKPVLTVRLSLTLSKGSR